MDKRSHECPELPVQVCSLKSRPFLNEARLDARRHPSIHSTFPMSIQLRRWGPWLERSQQAFQK